MATAPDERVAALLMRHQRLATATLSGDVPAAERAALVDDIVAAGAVTPPGAARDSLRDILFFWAGDQASRGERPPDAPLPALAPFDAPDEEDAAAGAPTLPSLAPAAFHYAASGMAGPFRAATVVRRSSSEEPDSAGMAAADVEAEARARVALRLAALARQWETTADPEARRGYLLTGKALTEATLYADADPDIQALVEASETESRKGDRRRRRVVIAMVATGVVALVGPVVVYLVALVQASEEKRLRDVAVYAKLAQDGAASTRSREAMLDATRGAVDALGHNDLDPLKNLLVQYGSASLAELSRLQLAPTAAGASTEVTSAKTPARDPGVREQAQTQAPITATCSGFLWFGSTADSRLEGKRDPLTLKAGEVATLDARADIRLRSDWPATGSYAMSAQAGVVPAGSAVTVTGAPRVFPRPSNPVWAPVTVPRAFCTTVFLQYVGDAARAQAVLGILRDIDVQTPAAEQVSSARDLAEVRCFWPEDRPVADQVAAALGGFSPDGKLKVVQLANFPVKPSSGTIEVWLDLSH